MSGEEGEDISSIVAEENYDDDFDENDENDCKGDDTGGNDDRGRDNDDSDNRSVETSISNHHHKDSKEKEKKKQVEYENGTDGNHGGMERSANGLFAAAPQRQTEV